MQSPIVSVIMPAFNTAGTILEAVNSVLGQSVRDIELIVCDDCSGDETIDVLSSVQDQRLRVLRNECNMGPGRSRDRAIALAAAPWIAFIDSDDAWQPHRLERLLAGAGDCDDKVIFDDLMVCHDVRGVMVPWRELHGHDAFGSKGNEVREIRLEDYVSAPRLLMQPLFPAHFIRENAIRHSERRFGEDAEFAMRLAAAGARLFYLPEPLYLYRIREGSLTGTIKDVSQMRQSIEACAGLEGWSPSMHNAFQRKIAALRRNEVLYEAVDLVRKGALVKAMMRLLANPGALRALPGRLSRHLRYQIHRVIHGGASR